MWWLIGGAVVLGGIVLYLALRKKAEGVGTAREGEWNIPELSNEDRERGFDEATHERAREENTQREEDTEDEIDTDSLPSL